MMLWQVVGFRFPEDADEQERRTFEADLSGLVDVIEDLAFATVARSVDDADTTCYVSCFADEPAFERYLRHPAHLPIADAAPKVCRDITRLMFEGEDPRAVRVDSPSLSQGASPQSSARW